MSTERHTAHEEKGLVNQINKLKKSYGSLDAYAKLSSSVEESSRRAAELSKQSSVKARQARDLQQDRNTIYTQLQEIKGQSTNDRSERTDLLKKQKELRQKVYDAYKQIDESKDKFRDETRIYRTYLRSVDSLKEQLTRQRESTLR